MKAAVGVVIAGVVLAIIGAITWWRASAARAAKQMGADFAKAYGDNPSAVSSAGVWFGAGLLCFGALVLVTGVALAVIKAR